MKVVLLGYMGVGKSTLGRLLAKAFQLKFIDLDTYIESKEQLSISELFRKKGEIYFRKAESLALQEIITKEDNFVLSLGGGTPVYGRNMHNIMESPGVVSVYLKLNIQTLVDRLFLQREFRPLISHYEDKNEFEEFVRKHLFERQQFYYMADHVLDLTGKDASESLDELIQVMNQNT
ncbi:shikimate kinase [Psychroflexus sp. YR1-1]|uniref:Shikimate kinase n=1 Tax=Psychroflexus aurantiacus TaxID=2709310 RepID=A0A6B3R6V6_9FLAO|nr:shikimate kinase [Psychroflexus aurantiacus]NEV94935.1 shikimate kinase [Psychroflexus aurantiacus]